VRSSDLFNWKRCKTLKIISREMMYILAIKFYDRKEKLIFGIAFNTFKIDQVRGKNLHSRKAKDDIEYNLK